MDEYNIAITYMKGKYGEKPLGMTHTALERIRKCRNESERKIERKNLNNYISTYNSHLIEDKTDLNIHLLINQYYLNPKIKDELKYALMEIGIINKI